MIQSQIIELLTVIILSSLCYDRTSLTLKANGCRSYMYNGRHLLQLSYKKNTNFHAIESIYMLMVESLLHTDYKM